MFRRWLALFLCLLMVLGLWPSRAQALMTLEEERKLGHEAYEEIKAQVPLITDPDILGYVRGMGDRLVAELVDNPFTYEFNVIDSSEMNAFAVPAGYVFFYRGMITALDSEAELAGIMGHEISHVSHRHLANRMDRTAPLNAAMLAGMLAGIVLGAFGGAPQLGSALTFGSMAGGIQQSLVFSREDEEQADYSGFKLMTGLGYPGQAMEVSFERIWQMERMLGADVPNYLRSHPTSPERMERMEDMVRHGQLKPRPFDNTRFLIVKTRLLALYDNEDSAETTFQRQRRENPKAPLPLYGMGLLEGRRGHFEKALAFFLAVDPKWAGFPYAQRGQANAYLRLGEPARAQDILRSCLLKKPDDRVALADLGQAYMQQDKLAEARQVYERLVILDPKDDQSLYDLGMALGKMGRTSLASLYLGLAFQERGNQRTARFHLNRAVQAPDLSAEEHARAERALEKLDDNDKKKKEKEEKERRERERREEQDRRDQDDGSTRRPDPRQPDSTRPW